jgi:hypothetical protein
MLPKAARLKVEPAIEQHLAAVEALMMFLDEADGDADAESSLGAVAADEYVDQEHWSAGANDEREGGHDGREPDVDDEFTLGWPERVNLDVALKSVAGTYWAPDRNSWYCNTDHEQEHDGREPSLGSTISIDQTKWAESGVRDLEGPQCEDD